MFIFKLDEPSLGKGFSLSLGHSIEENHGLHFIRKLVHMKGKIGFHGHEPFIGISSFYAELFKGAALMSTMLLLSSLSERRSIWMEKRKSESEESGELNGEEAAGGAGESKYCVWVRSPKGVADHK